MKGLVRIVVSMAVLVSSAWSIQSNQGDGKTNGSQTVVLITSSIDDGNLVTLSGNTRPEAITANDRGPVADNFPMKHLMLQLRRSPAQERELEEYIEQLQTPGSPNFHHWLTAQQLGAKYGLAKSDTDAISGWLRSYGFTVNAIYPNRMLIDFSGTAGQVHRAFHTAIHKLLVDGVNHIANMSDPRIPAAIAPAVAGIVSLSDFFPHAMHEKRSDFTFAGCGGECYSVVPADFATIYNLNPLYSKNISGQGQTIVVVEDTDVYSTSDWDTFRTTFGLASGYPEGSFTQVHPNSSGNTCTDPGATGNDSEATLDVEWASAAAPSAAIVLASCADTTNFGGFIALQNLLNSGTPPAIVSVSYGDSETDDGAAFNAAINTMYQQAVTEGTSVFVSSGDQAGAVSDRGAMFAIHGINVNGWASTVYNVAVGGTDYGDTYAGTNSTYWSSSNGSTYGSALSYIPEIPWNDSCGSVLIASFEGYQQTYGTSGFCNSGPGASFLNTTGGSGGPSACATGTPSVTDVVSGSCAGYAKPSWQSVFGNPSDGVRDLPDVALFAANGVWGHAYVVCFSDPGNGGTSCSGNPDTWFEAGGTSFASPIMAAIQSLVNQSTGKTWGNPNPTYYSLARSEYGGSGNAGCNSTNGNAVGSSCIFYDVTQGDMDVPCKADSGTLYNCYLPSGTYGVLSTSNSSYLPAYGTHTGWDFATGIGTVNAYNLVTGWSGSSGTPTTTKLALSASSISEGTASVTLTATITAGSGTPTGKVTFYKNGTAISQTGNPATLASGKATLTYTTSGLTVATYAISATYDPTGTFATSGSSPSQLAVQDFTVAANPTAVSVSAPGQSGTSTLTITPGSNGFSQAITFACSGLPTGANCTFTPSSVTPGSSPATTTLSITTTSTASRLHETPFGQGKALFYAMLLPGFLGLVSAGGRKRTLRGMRLFALLCAVGLCSLWLACGGGGTSSNPSTPAGNSTVTVTATSGVLAPTATIALTVQ